MDKDNTEKKRISKAFTMIICCTYLIVTGLLVHHLSQTKPVHPEIRLDERPSQTPLVDIPLEVILNPPQIAETPANDIPVQANVSPGKLRLKGFSARGEKTEKLLHPFIIEVADEHEIDPDLIKAIIWAESSFNPNAVSQKGALGLMQLMPSTARSLGVKDCMNPKKNIGAGVRYFKELMHEFDGDEKLALAAYNAGSGKVREYNGVPPFKATRYYLKKVLSYYERLKARTAMEINKT